MTRHKDTHPDYSAYNEKQMAKWRGKKRPPTKPIDGHPQFGWRIGYRPNPYSLNMDPVRRKVMVVLHHPSGTEGTLLWDGWATDCIAYGSGAAESALRYCFGAKFMEENGYV